jgi:class 3 adenylate cyclase
MKPTFVILVLIDIVDSTKFIERVGDMRASEVMRVYDRIFRGLLIKYEGLEIDKTDGALLLFETMRDALNYIQAYHSMVERHLGLKSRAGIHCGYIVMHSNSQLFVSRGAKPIEVEGIQKAIAARIMSLAGGGQTFLSKRAGEYAASVRGKLLMRDLGMWKLKGVKAPMQLYAIGDEANRLALPKENEKVKLVKPPKLTPKERRDKFLRRYVYFPIAVFTFYFWVLWLAFLEYFGVFGYGCEVFKTTKLVMDYMTLPFYKDFWVWLFKQF